MSTQFLRLLPYTSKAGDARKPSFKAARMPNSTKGSVVNQVLLWHMRADFSCRCNYLHHTLFRRQAKHSRAQLRQSLFMAKRSATKHMDAFTAG